METKVRRGDQPESAQRADHELGQVEARDVLDDFPASARERTVGAHEGNTDDEVPNRTEASAPGAVGIGRDDAAEGLSLRKRRIEGEALAMGRESPLELSERQSRFGDHDLVRGRILDDAREPAGPHDGVDPRGGSAQLEIRAAADEGERLSAECRLAEHLPGLVDGRRLVNGLGTDSENHVALRRGTREDAHSRHASPVSSVA